MYQQRINALIGISTLSFAALTVLAYLVEPSCDVDHVGSSMRGRGGIKSSQVNGFLVLYSRNQREKLESLQ